MIKALVTGGSRGIGRQVVKEFCRLGYDTYFLYKSDRVAALSLENDCHATALQCDVSDPLQVKKAFDVIRKGGHGIDVLVNNAGIAEIKPFLDIDECSWRMMMGVTLDGAYYCSKEALSDMLVNKWGRVINISSMWGQTGASCEVHYSTAKAGLIGMTKALALEFAPSGITVNCVCPGLIDTDMNSGVAKEDLDAFISEIPIGRIGNVNDVAHAVAFLCSEKSGYITGQVLGVNGGVVI